MPTEIAYKGFTDKQLSDELRQLNEHRKSIYDQVATGDRSYSKDLKRIDLQFSSAMKEWQRRGGHGIPESPDDIPTGGNSTPMNGVVDYSKIKF